MTTPLVSATATNAFVPLASSTSAPKTAASANLAVHLSNDSSLIASIGGASTSDATVYNAQGLMSNFLQASARNAAAGNTDTSSADVTGKASGAFDTANSSDSNASIPANTPDPNAFNGTPDWAGVLKADPSLSGVFLAESTNHLLVNQLSVFA